MIAALMASSEISFNVSIPNDGGEAVLHYVLRTPAPHFVGTKTDAIRMLLENGAEPFERDNLGESGVHILASMPTEEDHQLLKNGNNVIAHV